MVETEPRRDEDIIQSEDEVLELAREVLGNPRRSAEVLPILERYVSNGGGGSAA